MHCSIVPVALGFLLSMSAGLSSGAPDFDARPVTMTVAEQLVTDEVFPVTITFRNTGRLPWQAEAGGSGTLSTLVADDPPTNTTWGTHFMIQGQGSVAAPGEEFVYRSNLKAPHAPGVYRFCWRVHIAGRGAIGQPTPSRTITVVARPARPSAPSVVPPPDAQGRRALTFGDFAYIGSFRLPDAVGEAGAGFSQPGIALRRLADGTRRLFVNYTHPGNSLFEVIIPKATPLAAGGFAKLPMATVTKEWGRIGHDVPPVGDMHHVSPTGGIWWDDDAHTLYWTTYHAYWAGGQLPVLSAVQLADDGAVRNLGPWSVPSQKFYWGGVTGLPESFARSYTGGRKMALGFGGYYNICSPCSRGPALGAIATPNSATNAVEVLPLLGYGEGTMAPRDGDYFSGNCSYWDNPPQGDRGFWAAFDECRAGTFVDLPDGTAFVTFPHLATGRIGYDYGNGTTGGRAEYWYFYNTVELGAVARSQRAADLQPYQKARETLPGCGGLVTGACFDPSERLLYIVRTDAYPVDCENRPLVHVYRVVTAK